MKYFDVVNENDVVIGQVEREEGHPDSCLLYRTVHFTLLDYKKRKLLVSQRTLAAQADRKWSFLSETLLAGEDYPAGVFRGGEKQLGFFSKGGCGEYAQHVFFSCSQQEFARFFIVYWEGEAIKPNKKEIIDYKWLSLDSLKVKRGSFTEATGYWVKSVDWNSLEGWFDPGD